jgi:hypothetical protein
MQDIHVRTTIITGNIAAIMITEDTAMITEDTAMITKTIINTEIVMITEIIMEMVMAMAMVKVMAVDMTKAIKTATEADMVMTEQGSALSCKNMSDFL